MKFRKIKSKLSCSVVDKKGMSSTIDRGPPFPEIRLRVKMDDPVKVVRMKRQCYSRMDVKHGKTIFPFESARMIPARKKKGQIGRNHTWDHREDGILPLRL